MDAIALCLPTWASGTCNTGCQLPLSREKVQASCGFGVWERGLQSLLPVVQKVACRLKCQLGICLTFPVELGMKLGLLGMTHVAQI